MGMAVSLLQEVTRFLSILEWIEYLKHLDSGDDVSESSGKFFASISTSGMALHNMEMFFLKMIKITGEQGEMH